MKTPEIPDNERLRQEALDRLSLVDTHPEESFDRVTRLAQHIMGVPISAVSVIDRDRQWFKSIQGLDITETSRDVSFCGHTIMDDEGLVVNDAQRDPRFSDNPLVTGEPNISFYAGTPVRTPDGYFIGALCAIDSKPHKPSAEQLAALKDLGGLLEDILLLRKVSVRDTLTGAYNRRYFDEMMRKEWRRAFRHQFPLTILLIDIDYFKAYNDTLGHQAGDEVLRAVAQKIMSLFGRAGDFFARYGGEEFVVVMPSTNSDGARVVAERIHECVRELEIEHPKGIDRRLTVSIGGASALDLAEARDVSELIRAADTALYDAKDNGRDQTIFAPSQV